MKKFIDIKFLLVLIVLIGTVLRFYNLGDIPSGFHADEAAFGYNAYSLIRTGMDEYGKSFPLVLKSFGDYKGALYAYATIPFIFLFGLNPFAVRFASALFSSLAIILIYLFTRKLLGNQRIALVSALLFAISPWDITIARVTGDVEIGMFFTLLMSYFLLHINNTKRKILFFVLSVFCAVLASISYAPYRFYVIFIPVIFLIFSVRFVKKKMTFDKNILSVLIAIIFAGIAYSLIAPTDRLSQVSIFTNQNTQLVLEEQVREDQFNPVLLTRLFHNKGINYTRTILENAGQYFTLDYLFLNGGFPFRERIPNSGLFYLWQLPFLLLGLYFILRKKDRNEMMLIVWWLLLLVPTFLTFDEIPNVHRNLIVNPAILIIISIGINGLFTYKKIGVNLRKLLFIGVFIIGLFELSYFCHEYFIHQNVHRPWYRGYAYKELSQDLDKIAKNYKKIVVTKGNQSPYIYLLFYGKYSPEKYQDEGSPRDLDNSGFGNYLFVPLGCPPVTKEENTKDAVGEPDTLYIDMGTCEVPNKATLIKTIDWQDNSPAFKLIDFRDNDKTQK